MSLFIVVHCADRNTGFIGAKRLVATTGVEVARVSRPALRPRISIPAIMGAKLRSLRPSTRIALAKQAAKAPRNIGLEVYQARMMNRGIQGLRERLVSYQAEKLVAQYELICQSRMSMGQVGVLLSTWT